MNYIINESERNLIRRMHSNQKTYDSLIKESMGLLNTVSESVVITDWLSPDDKYLILFDELYDLHESKKIGDIWENFDNFKLFITHSFEVATNVPKEIKESVLATVKSLVLTESMNDLTKLKPFIKQVLREDEGFGDWLASGLRKTGDWAIDQTKKFGKDVSDLATKGWSGIKQTATAISKGDWSGILDILGKGLLFVARKIRSLMYNPVGIVLDSILVATGIGKGVQWIPWAIIVALDLYEIISGDYEEPDMPTWLRWLMIGTDVLGLVFAGGVAGSAKAALSVFKGARTAEDFALIAAKNPNTVKIIQKIIGAFSKVPEFLGKAATYLKSTKLAKASPWIQGILGKAEGVLSKGAKSMAEISNAAKTGGAAAKETKALTGVVKDPLKVRVKNAALQGGKTALTVAAIDKGFKKGSQLYYGISDEEMDARENTAKSFDNYEEESGGQTYGDYMDKELK
jgi:hypothetical protein